MDQCIFPIDLVTDFDQKNNTLISINPNFISNLSYYLGRRNSLLIFAQKRALLQ